VRQLNLPIALVAAVLAVMPPWPAAGHSDVAEAVWTVRQTDGLCLLERPVRDFGAIRFVGAPGVSLRLEVLGHRALFAEGAVTVSQVAPPWHPQHPQKTIIGETTQRAGSAVLIGEPLATRALMALYEGFEAHLEHPAWYGGEADIRIGNEFLRGRYGEFASCLQDATAQGWSAFERTRIEYGAAEVDIPEAGRARLAQVAQYLLADSAVVRVYVDGHTDASGPARANLLLSRQRAELVADYLVECGVPRQRLVVRYHGAQYPVASGADEQTRSENRRTTVRLERHWPDAEVASR
jgi:outer membrane protein OmpA-like peptidoglycan-associated protein